MRAGWKDKAAGNQYPMCALRILVIQALMDAARHCFTIIQRFIRPIAQTAGVTIFCKWL